jgi:hypothetical protein
MRTSTLATKLASMRTSLLLVVIALFALAAARALLGPGGGAPVTEHPVAIPDKPRTVTISATMPRPSAHERRLSAMLEQGAMPRSPTMAEVMTDTDCTPDSQMISHCRNEVRLPGGGTMVLRHPHDMRKVPCLAPGERVLLVPATI